MDQPRIKPVWQVIPRFFKYPFRPRVFPTLAFISVASALTLIPFLGLLFWLFLWAMLFKVSYEILTSTASGMMDGPPSVTQMSGGIMFKHMGLLLLMALVYVLVAGVIGLPVVAIALSVFMVLALPAAIMTLAMTQSLLAALNPATWVRIIRTTGLAYLLTSIFLLLLILSQDQAASFLLPVVGDRLIILVILSWFITTYFMAASFHLLGYLLYQFHEELGIDATLDTEPGGEGGKSESPALDEARSLIKAGRADEAVAFLADEIDNQGAEIPVHEFYRELLRKRGDHKDLVDHGKQLIPILVHAAEEPDQALDVAEECLKIDPKFQVSNPNDILPLARRASEQGRHRLVLRLTSGFARNQGEHRDLVENYFLAARSMIETGEPPEKAAVLVGKLRKRFPDHPLQSELARFEETFSGKAPLKS